MAPNFLTIILFTSLVTLSLAGHLHGRSVHVHHGHTIHGGEMGRYRSSHEGYIRPRHYGQEGNYGRVVGGGGFHMRTPFDEISGGYPHGHGHGPRFRSASESHIHTRPHVHTHEGYGILG